MVAGSPARRVANHTGVNSAMDRDEREMGDAPVYVVSGGAGASGQQLARTLLAQFPGHAVQVIVVPKISGREQLVEVVEQARSTSGTIVHTLVDETLRESLTSLADARGVVAIDLAGPLLSRLAATLGRPPVGRPGLFRELQRPYFERMEAIEFAITHDDGANPQDWPIADVVLVGISRTGKSPLAVYLSTRGWRVANVPLVFGLPAPEALFALDPQRVMGLTVRRDRLLALRRRRSRHLGLAASRRYADPQSLADEMRMADEVFRRGGFHVVDVTEHSIEATALEISRRIYSLRPRRPMAPRGGPW
jgi:regulator of PEP synthase PpsR (kinase-PPPase family)